MAFNYSYHKPIVISEIGANHKGSMDIAKELILLSKQAGCDVAKFQKGLLKNYLQKNNTKLPTLTLIMPMVKPMGNTVNS